MRMQDKANRDSQKKSVGEISDQQEQQPQDERKAAQTRTFTRWMNVFLQRRDPPVEVHDLFTDIQDGRILMALLEELSGCKLVRVNLYSGTI
uniref:Calponin-homology (CH) domain-containing protein n=1 Tax=Dicentrarchus labrax TaxID=13489 RepID=A0A8P4GD73_DICLA